MSLAIARTLSSSKSFTGALVAFGTIVFACAALAICTPGCALVQKTGTAILDNCGKPSEVTAGNQLLGVAADLLAGENYQVNRSLENLGA